MRPQNSVRNLVAFGGGVYLLSSDDLNLNPASEAFLCAVLFTGQPSQLHRSACRQKQRERSLSRKSAFYHLSSKRPTFIVNWPILSRLTSHFWIASIFHSFTLTKVLPASIPACHSDRKFSKNENILTLSQKCLNMENASPFLPDWTWPLYSRRAQPCPQVPPCTSSWRMMILTQRNGRAILIFIFLTWKLLLLTLC